MAEELYERTINCPICNREFTTKKMKTSAIRVAKRDEDFCPYYEGENPLFYGVFVCVHCGYAALESHFSNKKSQEDKKRIIDIITPRWNSRSYGEKRTLDEAIEVYKLALLCSNVLEEKSSVIGKICLRLSWFFRYKADEEERKFIEFTISSFEKAFTGERGNDDEYDEIARLYLLGELNRRLEKYSEAIMWFDKVLSHPHINKKRHIKLKARDQWSAAREQYKAYKSTWAIPQEV
ncbi:DUF2225 domain-containing protein [Wukongibacter sp. M2B1]|uniref:DUF2225 domain-containing protein n=1 Tax=Wukongibacter sp. M2B1 TaxID=3088895 RepID=UPI003D7934F5